MLRIVKMTNFCYNTLMISRFFFTGILGLAVLCAQQTPTAHAYMNPYDVLLSQDLLLPSRTRDSLSRIDRQQRESAARREREQQEIFAAQQPPVVEEELFAAASEEEAVFGSVPTGLPSAGDAVIDREFLTLMRTLERVQKQRNEQQLRQQALSLLAQEGLHSGAPLRGGFLPTSSRDLAPTGAGTFLAVSLVLIAIAWTVRRAKKEGVVMG